MGIAAPAALHADSERVAELCRAALGDHLPIVVARSPALEELRQGLFEHIGDSGAPSYRLGRIGKPHLQAFFTAAATYRKHRPWDVFADADIPLALSIPAIDLVDAACCVITDDDMGGLAIYPDAAAFVQTLRKRAPDVPRQEVWVVAYYDKPQMPPSLAKELNRLSFAPRRGPHPALLTLDRDGVARPPAKADFLAATLALGAVAQFADEVDADPDVDAKTIAIPVRRRHRDRAPVAASDALDELTVRNACMAGTIATSTTVAAERLGTTRRATCCLSSRHRSSLWATEGSRSAWRQ